MSHEPEAAPSWDQVVALVAQVDSGQYGEVELHLPGFSLRMSRSALAPRPPAPPDAAPAPEPAAAATIRDVPSAEDTGAPAPDTVRATEVTAPMLGVFYGRPAPDKPPFVTVGDVVRADTTVGIVEVMKLMNPVAADTAGTVVEICVQDGDLVEFGQPLLRIAPS